MELLFVALILGALLGLWLLPEQNGGEDDGDD